MTLLLVVFDFSDYVCTLLLQTIVVKCDYVLKKSANTFIAVVHLTIIFFSNYQRLVVVFTAALSPTIAIHSLLLTHSKRVSQMQLHISRQLSTITPISF